MSVLGSSQVVGPGEYEPMEEVLRNGEAMAEESSPAATRNTSGSSMEMNSTQTQSGERQPGEGKGDPAEAPESGKAERTAAAKESKTESKVQQNGRTGSSEKEEQLRPEHNDSSVKKPKKQRKRKKMKGQAGEEEEEDRQKENILECAHKENIAESKQKENSAEGEEQTSKKKDKTGGEKEKFPDYIPEEEIERILQDPNLTDDEYVKGYLRINPRFAKHAYVVIPEWDKDLLIISVTDRNRALEGDLVVARVNPPKQWKRSRGSEHKTGTVVCILDKVHPRQGIGSLKQFKSRVVFYPRDNRLPLLTIYPRSIPRKISLLPDLYDNTLCIANILTWKKPTFAIGQVKRVVGSTGDIEAESRAILLENNLDVAPYGKHLLKGLPKSDYVPSSEDRYDREYWGYDCVFTIDPDTAVDLDDAVSFKIWPNGDYQVGVHIADVTHYLEFLSPLDIEVAKRATTVYTTDNVYHMLPPQLCQLCSLAPGREKLAFSVIWDMKPSGEIVRQRFAKTTIISRCQMSYDQAQKFIESPREDWPDEDSLNIHGKFTRDQLADAVQNLYRLSVQLRRKRFANGALRIDQTKLHVKVDRSTGLPVSYGIEEHKDSNRLIEEFMLLANMSVATHLYETMPETALLRNHQRPLPVVLTETKSTLEKFGIHLDIDSAQSLQASIERYELGLNSDCEEFRTITNYRMLVINYLCAKAMQRATYRCASSVPEEELRHYALNVPLYTHFTSPIRRYSDCVVHRLLYSSTEEEPLPDTWTEKLCAKIAANCNVKKYSAKLAQEASTRLYFAYLVELMGSFDAVAIVADVKAKTVEAILCDLGIKLKVYLANIESLASVQCSSEYSVPSVTVTWKDPAVTQVVTLFSLIQLRVEAERNELNATLLPPAKS